MQSGSVVVEIHPTVVHRARRTRRRDVESSGEDHLAIRVDHRAGRRHEGARATGSGLPRASYLDQVEAAQRGISSQSQDVGKDAALGHVVCERDLPGVVQGVVQSHVCEAPRTVGGGLPGAGDRLERSGRAVCRQERIAGPRVGGPHHLTGVVNEPDAEEAQDRSPARVRHRISHPGQAPRSEGIVEEIEPVPEAGPLWIGREGNLVERVDRVSGDARRQELLSVDHLAGSRDRDERRPHSAPVDGDVLETEIVGGEPCRYDKLPRVAQSGFSHGVDGARSVGQAVSCDEHHVDRPGLGPNEMAQ